jgi:hypothetical protein
MVKLIAALDRRMPHIERIGEIAIARDAALSASGLRSLRSTVNAFG